MVLTLMSSKSSCLCCLIASISASSALLKSVDPRRMKMPVKMVLGTTYHRKSCDPITYPLLGSCHSNSDFCVSASMSPATSPQLWPANGSQSRVRSADSHNLLAASYCADSPLI